MKQTLLIFAVAMISLGGYSTALAQTSKLSRSEGDLGRQPQRAVRVTQVLPNSIAQEVGLHPMDVISNYGGVEILDEADLYFAMNLNRESPPTTTTESEPIPTVEIVVWRGYRYTARVRPGWLGVMTRDNDNVSEEFLSMMTRINTMREIPQYMHETIFKGQFTEPEIKILERAKALIDQAERENRLTPEQVELDRIHMVLDNASLRDQLLQKELLQHLLATQPANYIYYLGSHKFFANKRYRAAVACFNHHLKANPDDVSIRLNMAKAYNELEMYQAAEQAVDYVFEHKLGLSDKGQYIAYLQKSLAALGQQDYSRSFKLSEKAFNYQRFALAPLLMLLAAAQGGDIRAFQDALLLLQEKLPKTYLEARLAIDAAKAHALVNANQSDAAREVIQQWKETDHAEGKVLGFWRDYPGGKNVARTFSSLVRD
jgi:hypothetical protein